MICVKKVGKLGNLSETCRKDEKCFLLPALGSTTDFRIPGLLLDKHPGFLQQSCHTGNDAGNITEPVFVECRIPNESMHLYSNAELRILGGPILGKRSKFCIRI
jgi:hypothetical protein